MHSRLMCGVIGRLSEHRFEVASELPTIRDFAKFGQPKTRFPSQAVIINTNEKLKYQWVRKGEVSVYRLIRGQQSGPPLISMPDPVDASRGCRGCSYLS